MSSSVADRAGARPLVGYRVGRLGRRALPVLGIVYALLGLEHTIVWVALPSLALDLGADWEALSWIMDAYLLSFGGFVFLFGVLADRLGRRRAMLFGLTVFGVGAAVAARAESVDMLLGARVIMGVGAAGCLPATFATIKVAVADKDQPRAIAFWSGLGGVGIVLGPVTGGLLIRQFGWEAIFRPMVPVALVLGAASLWFVPESRSPERPRIDVVGSLLWVGCLFALLWATIELPRAGLSPGVIAAFSAGGVVGLGFLTWQLFVIKRPVIDLRALFNRTFIAAAGALFLAYFVLMGSLFPLAPYFQEVLGYEPWQAGLALLPVGCLLPAGAASVRLAERFGPKPLIAAGLGLIAAGMGILSTVTVDSSYLRVGVALGLAGLGMGPVLAVAGHLILDCLPENQAGVAAAIQQAVRLVGGAFGIGVLGAVVAGRYADGMEAAVRALPAEYAAAAQEHVLAAVGIAHALGPAGRPLREAALNAYVAAMAPAMRVSVAAGLLGAFVALVALPRRGTTAGYVGAPSRRRDRVERPPLVRKGALSIGAERLRTFEVDGEGILVVFAAGWRSSARHWWQSLEWLGQHRQRAVSLDLPGLGHQAAKGPLFDQEHDAIAAALDQLVGPAGRVILAGHSTGAAVLAAYAHERKDPRVAGLVLVAPLLKLSWRVRRDLLRAAFVLALPRVLTRPRLKRLAAEWSARPLSASLGRSAADQVAEQLRLIGQFMRELSARFHPNALTIPTQWVFFANDRTALLKGVLTLPETAHVNVIKGGHSSWSETTVALLGETVLAFARKVEGEPR